MTLPLSSYSPNDWYWVVDNDATQVYSSARVAYFPVEDATYLAWKESGKAPTRIKSADELRDVLLEQFPEGWPAQPKTRLSSLEFLALLTTAEKLAIIAAKRTDDELELWYGMLLGATYIDLTDSQTIDGAGFLVGKGLLTDARRTRLLSGLPPL